MSPDATHVASASVSSQNSVHSQPFAPAASLTTPSNQPAAGLQALDLRHITSNHNLAPTMKERTVSASTDRSGRGANFMSVSPPPHRLGSRSPASIPSSPTSVHSSSSAIFERDIELPPSHLVPHPHPTNPHRMPRSKITDPIEASVPSVLDSAAELLATTDEFEEMQVAVDAPATSTSRATSAIGSPIGRGSRSPSPTTSAGSRNRTSMLLNLPSPVQSSIVSVPVSPASPSSGARAGGSSPLSGSPSKAPPPLTTSFSAGSAVSSYGEHMPGGFSPITSAAAVLAGTSTPSSVGASTQYESASSSPKTTTLEYPPHPLPASSPVTPTVTNMFASHRTSPPPPSSPTRALPSQHSQQTPSNAQLSSHPPSPSHAAHKRLSFISYSDMLASTPVSTLPLSSLTSPGTADPPPHLPSVSLSVGAVGAGPGAGSRSVSTAASMAGSARNSLILDNMPSLSSAADVKEPSGGVGDDLGGEWEREGLGRGLEERLEALMAVGPGKA